MIAPDLVPEWLRSALSRIETGALLGPAFFARSDADRLLDERDGDASFAAAWREAHDATAAAWATADVPAATASLAERIRKAAFLRSSLASHQHDIASDISDDFELIVRDRILGLDDAFVARLLASYEANRFPTSASGARPEA